ncbi:MAG TPA: peptidoglycan-binding domain-containing protein [Streptosporangiaceae bacterium]|jgi:hypothetical protein
MIRRRLAAIMVAGAVAGSLAVIPVTAASAATRTTLCTTTASINTAHGPVAVPGTSRTNDNCSLFEGDVSNGVHALQEAMAQCFSGLLANGFKIDSDFGPITKTTLENIQRAEGQTGTAVDGKYGPITRNLMQFPSNDIQGRCFPL